MRAAAATHIASPDEGKPSRFTNWALAVIFVATAARLTIAGLLPYGVDEAYAVGMARSFSLSYFDHPPLHFWIVGAWAALWGAESPLLLRLPFVAMGAVSSWLMFRLASRLFSPAAGVWATSLLNLTPVFGLAHFTLILPDGPLLCASLLLANVVAGIVLSREHKQQLGRWLLAGVAAGLAMLSKYHGLLLVGGVFLFLLTSRSGRVWLMRPGPWLAALVAGVLFTPVLVWNAAHDWASFAFQSGRGGNGVVANFNGPVISLLQQAVYLLPWLAVALAVALLLALVSGRRRPERWLLGMLALPPILLFTSFTLFRQGLPHWQMPGWLFTVPLLAERLAVAGPWLRRIAKAAAVVSALLLALFAGAVLSQVRWGVFDDLLEAAEQSDPTDMLQSWAPVTERLAALGLPADDRSVVIAFNWVRAGHLNAILGRDVPVTCLCTDARHFQFINPPERYAGWTGIIIDTPGTTEDTGRLQRYFETLGPAERIDVIRGGRSVIPLGLRVGTGFDPDGAGE